MGRFGFHAALDLDEVASIMGQEDAGISENEREARS
jgi:hypothetical protein